MDLMFHGTRMRLHLRTAETGGAYGLIEIWHPPNVGPALHLHLRGPETFLVLEGSYRFTRGEETVLAGPGAALTVPAGVPHRYDVGSDGGHLIVVCPPGLEGYFEEVARRNQAGPVSLDAEFEIAAACGQEFLDRAGHWAGR